MPLSQLFKYSDSAKLSESEQDVLMLLGHFHLKYHQPDRAALILKSMLLLYPDNADVLKLLGLAYLQNNCPEDTLNTTDQLALLGQVDAVFHLLRAEALGVLGRAEEAHQSMQNFVASRHQLICNDPSPTS